MGRPKRRADDCPRGQQGGQPERKQRPGDARQRALHAASARPPKGGSGGSGGPRGGAPQGRRLRGGGGADGRDPPPGNGGRAQKGGTRGVEARAGAKGIADEATPASLDKEWQRRERDAHKRARSLCSKLPAQLRDAFLLTRPARQALLFDFWRALTGAPEPDCRVMAVVLEETIHQSWRGRPAAVLLRAIGTLLLRTDHEVPNTPAARRAGEALPRAGRILLATWVGSQGCDRFSGSLLRDLDAVARRGLATRPVEGFVPGGVESGQDAMAMTGQLFPPGRAAFGRALSLKFANLLSEEDRRRAQRSTADSAQHAIAAAHFARMISDYFPETCPYTVTIEKLKAHFKKHGNPGTVMQETLRAAKGDKRAAVRAILRAAGGKKSTADNLFKAAAMSKIRFNRGEVRG